MKTHASNTYRQYPTLLLAVLLLALIFLVGTMEPARVAFAAAPATVVMNQLNTPASGIDGMTGGSVTHTAHQGEVMQDDAGGSHSRGSNGELSYSFDLGGFIGIGKKNPTGSIVYGAFFIEIESDSALATAILTGGVNLTFSVGTVTASGGSISANAYCLGQSSGDESLSVEKIMTATAGTVPASVTSGGAAGSLNVTALLPYDTVKVLIAVMATVTGEDTTGCSFSDFSAIMKFTDNAAPKITEFQMAAGDFVDGTGNYPCHSSFEQNNVEQRLKAIDTVELNTANNERSVFTLKSWKSSSKTINRLTITDLSAAKDGENAPEIAGLSVIEIGTTSFDVKNAANLVANGTTFSIKDEAGNEFGTFTYVSHTNLDLTTGATVVSSITFKLVFTGNSMCSVTGFDNGGDTRTEAITVAGIDISDPEQLITSNDSSSEEFPVVGPIYAGNYGAFGSATGATNAINGMNWLTSPSAVIEFTAEQDAPNDSSPRVFMYNVRYSKTLTLSTVSKQAIGWQNTRNSFLMLNQSFRKNGSGYYTIALYTTNFAGKSTDVKHYFFKVDYTTPNFSIEKIMKYEADGVSFLSEDYDATTWQGKWLNKSVAVELTLAGLQGVTEMGTELLRVSGVKLYYRIGEDDYVELIQEDTYSANAEGYYNVVTGDTNGNSTFYARFGFEDYTDISTDSMYFKMVTGAGIEYETIRPFKLQIDRNVPDDVELDSLDDYLYVGNESIGNRNWYVDKTIELDLSYVVDDHLEDISVEIGYADSENAPGYSFNAGTYVSVLGSTLLDSNMYYTLDFEALGLTTGEYYLFFRVVDQAGNRSDTINKRFLIDYNRYYIQYYVDNTQGYGAGGIAMFDDRTVTTETITVLLNEQEYECTLYSAEAVRGDNVSLYIEMSDNYIFNRYYEWNRLVSLENGYFEYELTTLVDHSTLNTRPLCNYGGGSQQEIDQRMGVLRYRLYYKRNVELSIAKTDYIYNGAPIRPTVGTSVELPANNLITEYYTEGGVFLNTPPKNIGRYRIKAYIESSNAAYASEIEEATYTISATPLTVTAIAGESAYLGRMPQLDYLTEGLIGNDTALSGELAIASKDVGSYPITIGTLDFGSNYNVTFIPARYTIIPADFIIEFDESQINGFSKSGTYSGAPHVIKYSVSNTKYSFTTGLGDGGFTEWFDAYFGLASYDVGTHQILLTNVVEQGVNSPSNYNFVLGTYLTYQIGKTRLTITPSASVSKTYRDADPVVPFVCSGWVGGDDESLIVSGAFGNGGTEQVGVYDIALKTEFALAVDNYDIVVFADGYYFEITKRPITIVPYAGQTKVAGAALGVGNAIQYYYTGDNVSVSEVIASGVLTYENYAAYAGGETVGATPSILLGTLTATDNYRIQGITEQTIELVNATDFGSVYFEIEELTSLDSVYGLNHLAVLENEISADALQVVGFNVVGIDAATVAAMYPSNVPYSLEYAYADGFSADSDAGYYTDALILKLVVPSAYVGTYGNYICSYLDLKIDHMKVGVLFDTVTFVYGDTVPDRVATASVNVTNDTTDTLSALFEGDYPLYKIDLEFDTDLNGCAVGLYGIQLTKADVLVRSGEEGSYTYVAPANANNFFVYSSPENGNAFEIVPRVLTISFTAEQLCVEYGSENLNVPYTVSNKVDDGVAVTGSFLRVLRVGGANGTVSSATRFDNVSALLDATSYYGLIPDRGFNAGPNYTFEFDYGRETVAEVVVTVVPRRVAVTEADFNATSKDYDGTSTARYVNDNLMVSEFTLRNSDRVEVFYLADYGTYSEGVFTPATLAGDYSIRISSLSIGGAAGANYVFVDSDNTQLTPADFFIVGGARINSLTVTLFSEDIPVAQKQYDGTTAAILDYDNLNLPELFLNSLDTADISVDFVNASVSDVALANVNIRLHIANAAQYVTVNNVDNSVTVMITPQYVDITVTNAVSKITRKVVTFGENGLIVRAVDKVFDSTSAASFEYEFASGALVSGETLALKIEGNLGSVNVGEVNALISSITILNEAGTNFENYSLNVNYSDIVLSAHILPARLVVSLDYNSKVYDALSSFNVSNVSMSMQVNYGGKIVNVNSLPYTYEIDGVPYTLPASDYSESQLDKFIINRFSVTFDRYLVRLQNGTAFEYPSVALNGSGAVIKHDIMLANMTIVGVALNDYYKNFTPVLYVNGVIYSSGNVPYVQKGASEAVDMERAVAVGEQITVSKKMVTIDLAAVTVGTKVYDGTTAAYLANTAGIVGFCAGDDVYLSYVVSLVSASVGENVRANFQIVAGVNGNGLLGTSALSYYLEKSLGNYAKTQNITVTRRPIEIDYAYLEDKIYDGTTSVASGTATVAFKLATANSNTGIIASDYGTIALVYSGVEYDTSNAGQVHGKILISADISKQLSGGASAAVMNYELMGALNYGSVKYIPTTRPSTISQRKLTPSVAVTPKVYDGTTYCDPSTVSITAVYGSTTVYAVPMQGDNVAYFDSSISSTSRTVTIRIDPTLYDRATDLPSTNFTLGNPVEGEDYLEVKGNGMTITRRNINAYVANKVVEYGTAVTTANIERLYTTEINGQLEWITLQVVDNQRWWMRGEDKYIVYSDAESDLPSLGNPFSSSTAVGSHLMSLTSGNTANFTFTYGSGRITAGGETFDCGTLTINKANVIVYSESYKRGYKGANPEIVLQFSGFKNNQIAGLSVENMLYPTKRFAIVKQSDGSLVRYIESNSADTIGTSVQLPDGSVGLYVVYIDLTNASAKYYNFVLAENYATLEIEKAYVSGLTMTARTHVYDGAIKSITVGGTNSLMDFSKLRYDYYKSTDDGVTYEEALVGVNGVTNAGKYKVVARYNEDENFGDWQQEALLTIAPKPLAITVPASSQDWTGSSIVSSVPTINNVSELNATQQEALIAQLSVKYYDSENREVQGLPINAGKYSCVATYTAAAEDNYATSTSKSAIVTINYIYVTISVIQKSFIEVAGTARNVLYTTTCAADYIPKKEDIVLSYKNAKGETSFAGPTIAGTYTYNITSSNSNVALVGDITGLMFIGKAEVADGDEEEGIATKASVVAAADSTVIYANTYVQYSLITVKSTSTGKEESATNKEARYIWNVAETNFDELNVAAIVKCNVYSMANDSAAPPAGLVEVTLRVPSAVPDEFRVFVQLADGSFKELAYTQKGNKITVLTDTLGFFVFVYEDTLPLGLIIGLSIAGVIVVIALIVAIVLAKKSKRTRLVAQYVSESITAHDYRVRRSNALVTHKARMHVEDKQGSGKEMYYDEETGEYYYDDD